MCATACQMSTLYYLICAKNGNISLQIIVSIINISLLTQNLPFQIEIPLLRFESFNTSKANLTLSCSQPLVLAQNMKRIQLPC